MRYHFTPSWPLFFRDHQFVVVVNRSIGGGGERAARLENSLHMRTVHFIRFWALERVKDDKTETIPNCHRLQMTIRETKSFREEPNETL